jgi:hypothetical protein
MVQLEKGFKNRIDRITDPEWLEQEQRFLQRLLVAARDSMQLREVVAKTAYIRDRLKVLADEESDTEADQ